MGNYPHKRERGLSKADPMPSALANQMQDNDVKRANGVRRPHKAPIPLSLFKPTVGSIGSPGLKLKGGNLGMIGGAGVGAFEASLDFEVGTKLTGLLIYVRTKTDDGTITLSLFAAGRTVGTSSLAPQASAQSTKVGELALDLSKLDLTFLEDVRWWIALSLPDENLDIEYVEATVEHPGS